MRTSAVKCGAWSGPCARHLHVFAAASRPWPCAHSCSADLASATSAGAPSSLAAPVRAHHVARLLVARLEEDRAEQRLAGVGQDRLLVASAAAGLAIRSGCSDAPRSSSRATSAQVPPRTSRLKRRASSPSLAAGIGLAQELGDGEAQHAVAQELQPLVVAALGRRLAHAGVRERLLEQRAILEDVAERAPRVP